jgi:hypothetical protein
LGSASVAEDAVDVQRSAACGGGTGVFARRDLRPGEALGVVPLHSLISAADALDYHAPGGDGSSSDKGSSSNESSDPSSAGGEQPGLGLFAKRSKAFLRSKRGDKTAEGPVVAALLVLERHEGQNPYVNSLPWGPEWSSSSGGGGSSSSSSSSSSSIGGEGGEGEEEGDSLAEHSVLAAHRSNDAWAVGEDRLEKARMTAAAAAELLRGTVAAAALENGGAAGVLEEICLRALVLVSSRAFDLSVAAEAAAEQLLVSAKLGAAKEKGAKGHSMSSDEALIGKLEALQYKHFVMVPFGDMFNHPSMSALRDSGDAGERFQRRSIASTCIAIETRFLEDEGGSEAGSSDNEGSSAAAAPNEKTTGVTLLAPTTDLGVKAGDEIWMWYGNAGYGSKTPEEWDAGEAEFRFSYGFTPWA